MISDLDIYCAANLLLDCHGNDALIEAGRMMDQMLTNGNSVGRIVWRRIKARDRGAAGGPERAGSLETDGKKTVSDDGGCRACPGRCRSRRMPVSYNPMAAAIHAAARAYERCLTASIGRDDCGAEFIELQVTHKELEAAVTKRQTKCREEHPP
jgi:hypothetical protein